MTRFNASTSLRQPQQIRLWTRGCVLAMGTAVACLIVMVAAIYRAHRQPLLEVSPPRINPNTASMASLVRLPGIGKARAIDIIYYRENQKPQEVVFRTVRDLESIRGIGPKTADALAAWLTFETDEQADP